MAIEQTSATIQVEMEVTRYQVYRRDGAVQVWGYVGDYEVSVCLPLTDPRVAGIVPAQKGSKRSKKDVSEQA